MHLLLGGLQGLLTLTGQLDAAFEMLQRFFQADITLFHLFHQGFQLFQGAFKIDGGIFLGQGHDSCCEAPYVSAG